MFCPNCGSKLDGNARFCPECGTKVETAWSGGGVSGPAPGPQARPDNAAWRQHATEAENAAVSGTRVSPNVYRGSDGKYRWVYELSFHGNKSAGALFRKVIAVMMGGGGIVVAIIMLLMSLPDDLDEWVENIAVVGPVWIIIFLVLELLSFPVMGIVSAAYKGSYWTLFEMDDREIVQIQLQKTFQRTQVIGLISFLTDDNLADMMTSVRMATKDRYYTRFDAMRSVRCDPGHDLIDCNGAIAICPVYVPKEDYGFVKDFILGHVGAKCRVDGA